MVESTRITRYMVEGSELFLRPFCGIGISRYDLEYPFFQGDAVYATDGRVCLRVTDPAWMGIEGEPVPVPITRALRFPSQKSGWRPPSDLTVQESGWGLCPLCEDGRIGPWGIAGVDSECPGCCEAFSDNGRPLPHRNGCSPCPACKGTATPGYVYRLAGGGQELNPKYIVRILSLPDVELRWGKKGDGGCEGIVPLQFRFSGGSGLLMPIGQETKK